MTKKNKFLEWDLSPGNEMCFCCARPDSKEKMCSWFRSGDPVPGWVAIGSDEMRDVHSFKIFRCPQFLDSPDDPGMTEADYLQSCRSLVIDLYSKALEYKHLFNTMKEKHYELRKQLKQLNEDYKALQKKLPPQADPPEGAA